MSSTPPRDGKAPRRAVLLFLALAAVPHAASAQGGLPAPVAGITFDEWAAANARLAAGRPLPEVLATLGLTPGDWNRANAAFTEALRSDPPGGPLIARYGEAFARPDAGRFGRAGDAPKPTELATYGDFARIGAEMAAAVEAGEDPVRVLAGFGLTPFDWAREGARWNADLAGLAGRDPGEILRRNAVREAALAEARRRRGIGGRKPSEG